MDASTDRWAIKQSLRARAEANLADLPSNIYSKTLSDLLAFVARKSRLLLKEQVAA